MCTAGACDYYLIHCCLVFDYGYKDTAAFSPFQIFLNFFYTFFHCLQLYLYMQAFQLAGGPLFSGGPVFRWLFACNHMYAHIYAHIYARARGFLDSAVIFRRQVLDSIVIFRRIGIFSFFLPIGIFGTQTAIFRLQKHKFSIKSKILFGN